MQVVQKPIKYNSSDYLSSKEKLSEVLEMIKTTYDIYQKLDYSTITMGWDRNKARFYIKKKEGSFNKMTFQEFVIAAEYWMPVC